MTKRIIPIFYACDDRFARYTVVSLHSMKKAASKDHLYKVHVLNTNISDEMKQAIGELADECFEISFDNVCSYLESIEDKLPIRDYYTKTTYFRMFIAEMFPQYDKAIYIDGDTVVLGDISKLYNTDIGCNLVGACHEQAMVQVDVYGTYAEKVVGVPRHNFFNAGMIIINCDLFRKRKVLEKFLALLGEYNFVVTQDEDYLNLICKDRVFWLDQRWNTEVTEGFEYPYDVRCGYILHYIMVNKPWHYENCRCADIFWELAKETSVYGILREELLAYTEKERERDRISGENLYKLAIKETEKEDNYQNRLNKTRRSPDRVAVVKRIEEYERVGKFDIDVEEDPPSRVLLPNEIDYLRRSPTAKLKTTVSYFMAKRFLDKIQKEGQLVIGEIRGIEKFRELPRGAIITSNHFNPFDTFAIHEAFLRSGVKKKKIYRVIREGNYTSFPGFYGFLMRNFYTLPLSSDRRTMHKFNEAAEAVLKAGNFILIYPEQSMWWNYRKPKPLKLGAYSMAVKNGVPILPCFITMKDTDTLGEDGYPIQEYTINIKGPIFPDESLPRKDRIEKMAEENAEVWKQIYEESYSMPLEYSTEKAP